MKIRIFLTTTILLSYFSIYSQQMPSAETNQSIENQLDAMIEKASSWEKYKVIEKNKLQLFRKNVQDSLNAHKRILLEKSNTIEKNQQTIEKLNNEIIDINHDFEELKKDKDSIVFLGISLSKSLYQFLVLGAILVLSILLGFYIFRFSRANIITKKSLKDLEELREEFDDYRKRSIEREEKVRRQLQDVINQHKGI